MPNGITIAIAKAVTKKVPMIDEEMPPARPILRGISVKNCRLITGKPFIKIYIIMNINNPIIESAAVHINVLAIFSECAGLNLNGIFI